MVSEVDSVSFGRICQAQEDDKVNVKVGDAWWPDQGPSTRGGEAQSRAQRGLSV